MHLSLIGMSGIGKTYWSSKLETIGYERYSCDEIIARELVDTLARPDGSVMELGDWMGLPYEDGYVEREACYLACEARTMEAVLDRVESPRAPRDVVIDTTGSVVYLAHETIERMRRLTTVVYLEASPELASRMYRDFLTLKRPVVWNGAYEADAGKDHASALARCYGELLCQRQRLYATIADAALRYTEFRSTDLEPAAFLRLVTEANRADRHSAG